MLKRLPEFSNSEIIRSRDEQTLSKCNVLVDVGGQYVPEKNLFDHHQRGFDGTLDAKHTIKLSSAGLVYKHFGREVIQNITRLSGDLLEIIYFRHYTGFVEAFDAIDNGITPFDKTEPSLPKYANETHLPARVGHLNPPWNDPKPDSDAQFKKAMQLCGTEFVEALLSQVNVWLPARVLVEDGLRTRFSADPKGRIIVLPQSCPWKQHLFLLEDEQHIAGHLKYAVFEDQSKSWRIQSIPLTSESFLNRAPFPEPWRGKRDAALDADVGVEGCIFCHHNGFIGGHKTKEGAIAMAFKALQILGL